MSSMAKHLHIQNGRSGRDRRILRPLKLHKPKEYRLEFPRMSTPIDCPVEGFPGRAKIFTSIRLHFMHRNAEDTIVVLNKIPISHPQ